MPPLVLPRIILLSSLSIPAGALFLTAFLHNHPLPASRSREITASYTLSPSAALSRSLKIFNPRGFQALQDTRSIFLSKCEIRDLNDEEILASFTKGFFGGWVFVPEKIYIRFWTFFGKTWLPVGFSGIESSKAIISSYSELSPKTLPPKYQRIIDGNFMILDYHLKSVNSSDSESESFVEIAYGDDRKTFSGMHRFEVSRQKEKESGEEGIVLSYSSYACNPAVDEPIFRKINTNLVWSFHQFYALCLFRDGVREVLNGT